MAGFPPLITFNSAINCGAYHTWPGLTVKRVNTLLSLSPCTAMGHLHVVKQGIQLTHTQPHTRKKWHKVGVMTFDNIELKHIISTDIPGRYPIKSAKGRKYIFIMVDYDSNYIYAIPIKSRRLRRWSTDSMSATTSYGTTNSRQILFDLTTRFQNSSLSIALQQTN